MKVIIVCHTEFGFVKNRCVVFPKSSIKGVAEGVYNLNEVANKYGAKITFTVTPETAIYFPKKINHEIGLHTHPGWEEFEVQGIKYFAGDKILKDRCKQLNDKTTLPEHTYNEQLEMIRFGRDYLKKELNVVPTSHVAGRWAINNDTVKALKECGFTHDCSVIPHAKQNHYDYSNLPRLCKPYHISYGLLEIPVSNGLFSSIASPESMGLLNLKLAFLEYYFRNQQVFHICLHSPCMTSLYYISYMDNLLKFISKHNIEFAFVSETGADIQ